jgi:hypothetical protein
MKPPLERSIEQYFKTLCERAGALTYKFTSPSNRSVPDRIVIFQGQVAFVELKRPGQRPTPLQSHTHQKMRAQGARVIVIDSREYAERWVRGFTHAITD